MKKVLLIDDDESFLRLFERSIRTRFPAIEVHACSDPLRCLADITKDLDLVLVDLEMPGLDGSKVLAYATSVGVDKNRFIILSGRDAAYLHRKFPLGSCLAVLNKHEAKQQEVLDMILRSLEKKAKERCAT